MSNELEKARMRLEFKRVQVARETMEFNILELQESIKRIQSNIEIQLKTEKDLEKKLADFV